MNKEFYFNTIVEWDSNFNGILSEQSFPNIKITTPPVFSEGKENTWTPEHLFVASVNICLMTTFLAIAKNSKLNFKSYKSEAKGKLEKIENKFLFTEITIFPEIKVNLEKDIERTERILKKAEQHCLISNSIKTKVILSPEIRLK
jgi:organic hydroperoxide reductase OsmC/OhrA